MEAIVTRHAMTRGKQRLGLGKKAMRRHADRAMIYGYTHAQFHGSLRRYLDCVYLEHKKANNLRVYGEHIYLFAGVTLITVLHVPTKYCPIKNYVHEEEMVCGSE